MRLAISLPVVIATAWVLAVAVGERGGGRPFAAPPYRNSAEAAAVGDVAAMLRLLRLGDNPTWIHRVRPELISSEVVHVTTPEAALWSRQIKIIRVLDREGAIGDQSQRRELACLARDLGLGSIAEYLAPGGPPCVPNQAMQRLTQRSAGPSAGGDDE